MAVTAMLETPYGETRETYVRINSLATNNHGVSSAVLCRGYLSQAAFAAGAAYIWEQEMAMLLDVSAPLWSQAYDALKLLPEFADAVDC